MQGYEGAICENDVMECLSAPCQNGGACRDDVGSFMCDCLEGRLCVELYKLKIITSGNCFVGKVVGTVNGAVFIFYLSEKNMLFAKIRK